MTMRRSVKITGLLLIFGLLFGAGCKRQAVKQSGASPHPTAAVKQTVEAFGVIKAREYKDINLEFPVQITAVPAQDGERVKRGQALIYLNTNDFRSQIKEKETKLYEARFDLLKQQKVLRDARDAHQKALDNLRDKEKLLREGALSAQEVDDYRDVVLEKERAVTDIKLSLDNAGGVDQLGLLREKVRLLEDDLARMRRKLDQSFLKGNVIVADFASAVVYGVNCAAGYSVGFGDDRQKLLSIMNLDSLYVSAEVPEEFIKDVKLGKAVTIVPQADNKRKYRGKVIRIAAMAVTANGETNVAVEVSVANTDGFLRPNFNVDVEIEK